MNPRSIRDPAIYSLTCRGKIFYVGRTGTNTEERMWQHVYRARSGHQAPVYEYMRDVGISNVQIDVLQHVTDSDDARALEAEWIKRLINLGAPLTNRFGRDGVPDSWDEQARVEYGNRHRGKPTWIKGKHGDEAGWTEGRKRAQSERAAVRRLNRVPNHGTEYEYMQYGCRCDECCAAALHPRVPVREHGRYLYKRDHCRCDICVAANRAYLKAWNAQRRDKLAA